MPRNLHTSSKSSFKGIGNFKQLQEAFLSESPSNSILNWQENWKIDDIRFNRRVCYCRNYSNINFGIRDVNNNHNQCIYICIFCLSSLKIDVQKTHSISKAWFSLYEFFNNISFLSTYLPRRSALLVFKSLGKISSVHLNQYAQLQAFYRKNHNPLQPTISTKMLFKNPNSSLFYLNLQLLCSLLLPSPLCECEEFCAFNLNQTDPYLSIWQCSRKDEYSLNSQNFCHYSKKWSQYFCRAFTCISFICLS